MIKKIVLIFTIIFSVKSYSQDPAFTQSFMVPETINPSFSGFYQTTKAGLLYKNQQWSGIEIETDIYSDFAKGSVGVRALGTIDVALRHGESFSLAKEAIAA